MSAWYVDYAIPVTLNGSSVRQVENQTAISTGPKRKEWPYEIPVL